jgi:copper homeostasis protein
MRKVKIEVCLDSVESAINAQLGGADRVELCDNLMEGGTTPSAGTIELARQHLTLGLQVIIRPRGGDFYYSDIEKEIMKKDVLLCKSLGVDGVVFGFLNKNGTIDKETTKEFMDLAKPMNVTFHRAFDMTNDPFQAMEDLIELGVDRILTSGQENSALEGLDLITELVEKAKDRIIIMPGCGITPRNQNKIAEVSKVKEMHVVGNKTIFSEMEYRNQNCFMGTELRSPEYSRTVTDPKIIESFVQK